MEFIVAIGYIFTILVAYTILRFIETDEDPGLQMMYSIFWPVIIAAIVIVWPFYFIDKLVKKIKRNKNIK